MSGKVSHGNTPAAWIGTVVLLAGALLVSLGVVVHWSWLWIAGTVLCVAGAAAWIGLQRAGGKWVEDMW
ncbi:MAG: hypothetical protein M9891_10565 [Austwickia sp.]|nr:hypothetical protein [Actinomycetota bacterium]MCO5309713.1 hypothetical protein [Austwickia sp.]